MLDGSPLLDIKPYVPEFDIHTVDKLGWYAKTLILKPPQSLGNP
jgi:tRNA (adenine37-N6)-methyltransferase